MSSFYSKEELLALGFKSVGENVLISRYARIYGAQNMSIGNNVRIDDFCILSGKIEIHDYVHVAVYAALFAGNAGIVLEDYSGVSSRCAIYAESDDYSGAFMTNPTVPMEWRNVISGKVIIGKYVVVGTGSTILPGVCLAEGCSCGAMTLLNKSTEPWGIYVGIPAKRFKDRDKGLLKFVADT